MKISPKLILQTPNSYNISKAINGETYSAFPSVFLSCWPHLATHGIHEQAKQLCQL